MFGMFELNFEQNKTKKVSVELELASRPKMKKIENDNSLTHSLTLSNHTLWFNNSNV